MTLADREAHVPSVSEEVVGVVEVTTLSRRQYCVVLDPVGPDGKPQLGQKKVVKVGARAGPTRLNQTQPNSTRDSYTRLDSLHLRVWQFTSLADLTADAIWVAKRCQYK